MSFPTWPLPPIRGRKYQKKIGHCGFSLEMMKCCSDVFSKSNFRGKVFCTYFCKTPVNKLSESMQTYTFLWRFYCTPSWRKCANFEQLWFRNGWIYHSARTVIATTVILALFTRSPMHSSLRFEWLSFHLTLTQFFSSEENPPCHPL